MSETETDSGPAILGYTEADVVAQEEVVADTVTATLPAKPKPAAKKVVPPKPPKPPTKAEIKAEEKANEKRTFLHGIMAEVGAKDGYGEYITFTDQTDLTPNYLNPKFFFRTGITLVDHLLGYNGNYGLGSGRMTELYGQNRTGKSALATELANRALLDHPDVHVLYIDMERALTQERINAYPAFTTTGRFNIASPTTLDKAFQILLRALSKAEELNQSIFVIFDSVAAMKTDTEMAVKDGKVVMMAQAQMFSKELPRVRGILSKTNSHLLMLNQMRDKNQSGGKPGMPAPDHTPGGQAIKFYADYRIKTASAGKYSFANGTVMKKGSRPSGFISAIRTVKNKVGIPDRTVKVPLVFFATQGARSGLSERWSMFQALKDVGAIKVKGNMYVCGDDPQHFPRVGWAEYLDARTELDEYQYPKYFGSVEVGLAKWVKANLTDNYGSGGKGDDENTDGEDDFEDD